MRRSLCALVGAALLGTCAGAASAQDLYIGTLEVRKDEVILVRCDLAANRYLLRDRQGEPEQPVAKLREKLKTLKAPVYVEVIGQYVEIQGHDGNALDVIGLENLSAGKSCHLVDALGSK